PVSRRLAAQDLQHVLRQLAGRHQRLDDRLFESVHGAVGIIVAELAPVRVGMRPAGEPRLEQVVGELFEQVLEVDRVQELGQVLGVRSRAHAVLIEHWGLANVRAMTAPYNSGPFSALRNRNFRLFFTGQLISLIGIWMQQVALSWLVLERTNSAWYVGLVNALDALPVMLLALYAGVVADRMSRRRLVIITKLCSMVLALLLAAMVFSGYEPIWPIMLIAAGFGVA